MSHHCHATDCETNVPPEMLMCRKHWFMVPKALRDRVWATYRVGQCDDWQPSAAYCDAASAAVIAVAKKEGRAPDVTLYDAFRPEEATPRDRRRCDECGERTADYVFDDEDNPLCRKCAFGAPSPGEGA